MDERRHGRALNDPLNPVVNPHRAAESLADLRAQMEMETDPMMRGLLENLIRKIGNVVNYRVSV